MKRPALLIVLIGLLTGCGSRTATPDYTFQAVPFTDARFTDGFWAPRIETVSGRTIPFAFRKCEETGRIANFAVAAGLAEGDFQGLQFNDSDLFKIMEGASYRLAVSYDARLDRYMDSLIRLVALAQEPDGYLYTPRTIGRTMPRDAGEERWSNIRYSHELYNVGHLYEAAVAHYYATGKRTLLDVAVKNADLLYATFYEPDRKIVPGHEEIELALVKLYRATHDPRYLTMARFFLDARGSDGEQGTYSQDHLPVTEQREAVGHAVRGLYLYMGMADVAALEQDAAYIAAIDSLWNNIVSRKLYITGGVGGQIDGEAFGDNYRLPNDKAYCETCAAIANCMWNQRMFQLHGDAKYIDVLERSLYNNVLSGLSLDGMEFFYPNVLEVREAMFGEWSARRSPWFDCSCCPSNLSRFIPSLSGYIYATGNNRVYVNLFGSSEATLSLGQDRRVAISQRSDYPWSGEVEITVDENSAGRFDLLVRIPGWTQERPVASDLYRYVAPVTGRSVVWINGEEVDYRQEKGYAVLSRTWKAGDRVSVSFPMEVRKVKVNERVVFDRGKFAVERGPIVYCAEGVDHPGRSVVGMGASTEDEFRAERSELFDRPVILRNEGRGITLIPYYARAHRGLSEMSVYLREE